MRSDGGIAPVADSAPVTFLVDAPLTLYVKLLGPRPGALPLAKKHYTAEFRAERAHVFDDVGGMMHYQGRALRRAAGDFLALRRRIDICAPPSAGNQR